MIAEITHHVSAVLDAFPSDIDLLQAIFAEQRRLGLDPYQEPSIRIRQDHDARKPVVQARLSRMVSSPLNTMESTGATATEALAALLLLLRRCKLGKCQCEKHAAYHSSMCLEVSQ